MISKKIIGPAVEFFRLRIKRVDEPDEPTLDWRDDILYRTPTHEAPAVGLEYLIEAVDANDDGVAYCIAHFGSKDEAQAALDLIQEDLQEMTVSSFQARYFVRE